jgi:hypothetical protein
MTKRQTVTVQSGKYQLNVGTWPAGTSVREWEASPSGLFASSHIRVAVVNSSAISTVERGERVTLVPVMRRGLIKYDSAPTPIPAAN